MKVLIGDGVVEIIYYYEHIITLICQKGCFILVI